MDAPQAVPWCSARALARPRPTREARLEKAGSRRRAPTNATVIYDYDALGAVKSVGPMGTMSTFADSAGECSPHRCR
jgi:hypothetical protein